MEMKKIKVFSFLTLFLLSFILGQTTLAQNILKQEPEYVKARVIRILEEKDFERENGNIVKQQKVELLSLGGKNKGEIFIYNGISELDVLSGHQYSEGDRVFLSIEYSESGELQVYIVDYVRERSLFFLFTLFVLVVLLVGKKIGIRSIIALGVSFLLILKVLAPLILAGYNPVLTGLILSISVLLAMVYITEGFNTKAHISVISIFITLLLTLLLSWFFVNLSRLSGMSSEETIFLISDNIKVINFKGLLLSAIIIGALGVLDDIAVGQVEAVQQLILTDPTQSQKKLFKSAITIGRAHLGAIINTLFLAYVGASLPLILLFNVKSAPFVSFSQVINHESIATEIVRTLVGAIGLCLAMPIATLLAVLVLNKKKS
ncbi:MAG: YibE/F family protein [Clostridia bacterium]|nr:YibE/F family protein [Clostridia bacterium]